MRQGEPATEFTSTSQSRAHPRFFYGWWMVLIASCLQFLSGGLFHTGLTVFFLPISRDLEISRAAMSLAFTMKTLEGGLNGPIVGYLIDRFGPKVVVAAGGVVGGFGFILLAFTQNYLSFMVVFLGLVVSALSAGVSLPTSTIVNHWFARQRALAVTLAQIGAEFGGALMTPLLAFIVLTYGWREAAILSGIIILVLYPILSVFLRVTPESMGLHPDGDEPADGTHPSRAHRRAVSPAEEFTSREAYRTRAFRQLAMAVGTRQFSKQSLMVHMVPLLVWKGIDEATAAIFVGIFALSQVPLRIGAAALADRWSMTRIPALSALAGVGAVAILLFGPDAWWVTGLLFALCFAVGETGNSPAWAVVGTFFGRQHFATIRGSTGFAQSLISLPAPVLAGWLYDTTQSYTLGLLPVAVSYGISFLLFWSLRPPTKQTPDTPRAGTT